MYIYIYIDLIGFCFTIGNGVPLLRLLFFGAYHKCRSFPMEWDFLTSILGLVAAGIGIYQNQYSKPLPSGALLLMPNERRKREGKLTALLGAFQLYHSVEEELSKKLSKLNVNQEGIFAGCLQFFETREL